jgi:DNA-binding MarR family transcriptional regulator
VTTARSTRATASDRRGPTAEELAPIQGALEQLQRLKRSRRAHTSLVATTGVDLSPAAYTLLKHVDRHGPCTLGELARVSDMDAAATGRGVRRLEELGLLARSSVAADARVTEVRITPEGAATCARVSSVLDTHLRDAVADWSATDRRELGRLLTRLLDDMRAHAFRDPTKS